MAELLYNYLQMNKYTAYFDKSAIPIFEKYKERIQKICGEIIYDTLEGIFMDDDESEDTIRIILCNSDSLPTSVFVGYMETDEEPPYLESSYTCSSELKKGGALLRFLGLLVANKKNSSITTMTGGISGGIPAIKETDTIEQVNEKRERLARYHAELGAVVENKKFTYHLDKVLDNIPLIFSV